MLLDPGCSLFPRTWVKNRRRIPSIKKCGKTNQISEQLNLSNQFFLEKKKIPQHSLPAQKYSRRMPGKARAAPCRQKQLRRPRPRAARSTPLSPHPPGTIRISRFRSFVGMKKRTRRTYLHSPSTSETGPLLFLLFTSTPSRSSWIATISLAPSALGLQSLHLRLRGRLF